MSKGQNQEGQELKGTDNKFIDEFDKTSTEAELRAYEIRNRDRISDASLFVRDAFDKKWKDIIGKPYFQAITTIPQVMAPFDGKNDTRRSDPRSLNYRESILFKTIYWQRIRRTIGKKIKDFFIIDGLVSSTKTKRPILTNLSVERLFAVFGKEVADKIIATAKREDRGEIDINTQIDVQGYWQVQFAPQKDQYDTPDVRLFLEGVCIRFKRMTEVILPGFYLENADHTTKPIYTHDPGKGRMKVGEIQKYPYTVLRQATMEEYLAELEKGNKEQREFEKKQEDAT
uniref:Uncharacterized protein n=2 Tax=viral metagenome TaxID=1070528 RepID=A0A6H1ZL18_9ZZZZ